MAKMRTRCFQISPVPLPIKWDMSPEPLFRAKRDVGYDAMLPALHWSVP